MKIKSFVLPILLFFTACSVDYPLGETFIDEPDRIIVNSILTPVNEIEVKLFYTHKTGSGYGFSGLRGAHVLLKENDLVLYDAVCPDSILRLPYKPMTGSVYSIKVSTDNLPEVNSETSIPAQIQCEVDMAYNGRSSIVYLDKFVIPENNRSVLWILAYQLYEEFGIFQYTDLYTKHALIDKSNSVSGMDVENEEVGSVYYEGFLRVKNKNLPYFSNLAMTPSRTYYWKNPDTIPSASVPHDIMIKLLTATPEYDQYSKSLYDNKSMVIYDDGLSTIFYRPQAVYTNIKNGLGIFAGRNEIDYYPVVISEP